MAGVGGDVKFIEPFVEAKYFRPMNKRRNTLGIRGLYSFITGYGGLQPPIYSRFYTGGEDSIRGFDFRTISPRAEVTTRTFVNGTVKDPFGNPVIDPQTGGTYRAERAVLLLLSLIWWVGTLRLWAISNTGSPLWDLLLWLPSLISEKSGSQGSPH